jgi:hypothetical protein
MKRRIAALLLVPTVFLVGCAEQTGTGTPVEAHNKDNPGYLPGELKHGSVTLPSGRTIECITVKYSNGNSTWGGLDCDWGSE